MNSVFENIIEKLEEIRVKSTCNKEKCDTKELCRICVVDDAIEIVKQEAEKFGGDTNVGSNGWIPCSERLPKENGYYYVTQIVKSVSTGKKIAIEKAYVEFSIGEWRRAKHLEVIAWLDIEPYQPKGE